MGSPSAGFLASHGTAPPALGSLELSSIARGLSVADHLVKRAQVKLISADPVSPGKFLLLFVGGEEEVHESLMAGKEAAEGALLDSLYLPHIHPAVVPALTTLERPPIEGSIGALEFSTVSSTLLGADAALKTTEVALVALHLARGIDGKGYLVFTGTQSDVEASLEAGEGAALSKCVGRELIARPHPDLDWALTRL